MNDIEQHTRRVIAHYDKLAENGPYGTLTPYNQGGRKSRYVAAVFDYAIMSALPSAPAYECMLDYGCGTGTLTHGLSSLAREVIGVDISGRMIDQAKAFCHANSNVHFQVTDGIHVPVADNKVDCTVTREVLCYVPDDTLPEVLQEIWRATRPDGTLFWLEQVSDVPYWQQHPDAQNLIKRSPESIRTIARATGWKVEQERIVRTPRFPWIYPVWFGLVPQSLIPKLARWEARLHAHANPEKQRRHWRNVLFVLRKPDHE